MIRNVLEGIGNVESFPIIALAIFVAFFIGMIVWVIRMKKNHVNHMRKLPLDSEGDRHE
jgi:cbb3-type cytochrome oxidase subunit 3